MGKISEPIHYFDQDGDENTCDSVAIVYNQLMEGDINSVLVVVACSRGGMGPKFVKRMAKETKPHALK